MKKSILNLEGTRQLNVEELKKINGGRWPIYCIDWHPSDGICLACVEGSCLSSDGTYCSVPNAPHQSGGCY